MAGCRALLKNGLWVEFRKFGGNFSFDDWQISFAVHHAHLCCSLANKVEGMMNSKAYLPIIKRKVSSEFSKLHPQAIFQQDSAPYHEAKIITNCFKKMKKTVLDWPGNSPDLINPRETLWSIVKNRLRKMDCTTKIKLIEAVIHVGFMMKKSKKFAKPWFYL